MGLSGKCLGMKWRVLCLSGSGVPPAIMPPSRVLAPLPTVPVSYVAAHLPLPFPDKDGAVAPLSFSGCWDSNPGPLAYQKNFLSLS